jgi:putative acetyltransferase
VRVRPAFPEDLPAVLEVERAAFGRADEPDLVCALLADPTAQAAVDLVAEDDHGLVGHILLTSAALEGTHGPVDVMLLAPLAVVPGSQGRGVGASLVREALDAAAARGICLVFVLGTPGYYRRFGFVPASPRGLRPPYPMDAAAIDAWMVIETRPGMIGDITGSLIPAMPFRRPELWRE